MDIGHRVPGQVRGDEATVEVDHGGEFVRAAPQALDEGRVRLAAGEVQLDPLGPAQRGQRSSKRS